VCHRTEKASGQKAIRRGSFLSVPDLKNAIEQFMDAWNENPKPFIWKATVEHIITKIDRVRAKAEQIKSPTSMATVFRIYSTN
jgi:hypothetical protein